jgi:putative ATPase
MKDGKDTTKRAPAPLAERMRPANLSEFIGQRDVVGAKTPLLRAVESGTLPSLLFWGPPGSGKTSLARLLADVVGYKFEGLSAVGAGVKEVRAVVAQATESREEGGRTLLFLDEIHRFNKAQQDALLPHVEAGVITLVGATTENPAFQVNSALMSRLLLLRLEPLDNDDLVELIDRAIADTERGLGSLKVTLDKGARALLLRTALGDARRALNVLEAATLFVEPDKTGARLVDTEAMGKVLQSPTLYHDADGDWHYDVVSALIKAMRGSDPDAALYWLARMVEAGEDQLFIARRMVIFASEDIGNADPEALRVALAVKDSVHFIGVPEGWIPLAQGVTYLATAPKSNASYAAYKKVRYDIKEFGNLPVPNHLRNAPTKLAKSMGHSKGYLYPHDDPDSVVAQSYFPEAMGTKRYYRPGNFGFEKTINERLEWWRKKRAEKKRT